MFGTLGGPELFLIFVVGLIVFGPRKLPEIGKTLGKMISEFKRASSDFQRTVEEEVENERLKIDSATAETHHALPPAPSAEAPTIRSAEGSVAANSMDTSADLSGDTFSGMPAKSDPA
jgi:Tat protein translocase TatB subunit